MPDSTSPLRDPEAVYRVVRIVATHPDGWEQAAAAGIEELAKSITDLRLARVSELDALIGERSIVHYRVKLEASYRIDRRRRDQGAVVTVRRVLVIANESIGLSSLTEALNERARDRTEFHLLAPVSPMSWGAVAALGDPGSGYVPAGNAVVETHEDSIRAAEERVREELYRLRALGSEATGEVAMDDPLDAVVRVLERGSFDEILVSTLPSTVSRWLRLDLTSRLRRRVSIPITEITAPS